MLIQVSLYADTGLLRRALILAHHVGLFGIAASVAPHFTHRITDIIAHQLDSLTRPMRGGITESELARAKNQLKSSLVMALESRSVEVEGQLC
jgi:processing peptidase subunit alpha